MPSTAGDAAGLLNAAFESGRPTVFFYPKVCLNDRSLATSPDVEKHLVPLGKAASDNFRRGPHPRRLGQHHAALPRRGRRAARSRPTAPSTCSTCAASARGIAKPSSTPPAAPADCSWSTKTTSPPASAPKSSPPSPKTSPPHPLRQPGATSGRSLPGLPSPIRASAPRHPPRHLRPHQLRQPARDPPQLPPTLTAACDLLDLDITFDARVDDAPRSLEASVPRSRLHPPHHRSPRLRPHRPGRHRRRVESRRRRRRHQRPNPRRPRSRQSRLRILLPHGRHRHRTPRRPRRRNVDVGTPLLQITPRNQSRGLHADAERGSASVSVWYHTRPTPSTPPSSNAPPAKTTATPLITNPTDGHPSSSATHVDAPPRPTGVAPLPRRRPEGPRLPLAPSITPRAPTA